LVVIDSSQCTALINSGVEVNYSREQHHTKTMENFNLLLPDNFQDLEKNHENVYSVRGTGKTFSKQDFRDFSEQFSRKISKDPTSIAESELYEPAYYLTKLYTRDPAYSKILEKVVLTVGANFHKILNSITEPIKVKF
jgi:hypothetical protein